MPLQQRAVMGRARDKQNLFEVRDKGFMARTLDPGDEDEMELARAFRHSVFLDELGWFLDDAGGYEVDRYDAHSVHFGVFTASDDLAGYCRIILPAQEFMIEREFAGLVDPTHTVRKQDDTAEISRFAIQSDLRGKVEGFRLIALLLRCVYRWALAQSIRYIYGVCATDHLDFVRGHFSCVQAIGPAYEYQADLYSSALLLDLEGLDPKAAEEFWNLVIDKPRP